MSRKSAPVSPAPPVGRWFGFTPRQHLAALAIFAAVTLAFFFPLLQGETFSDVDRRQRQTYPWAGLERDQRAAPVHYDYDDSFYPWQVFVNRELRQGEFPYWNPYNFAGAPFFANGQSGVLYPPRLALSLTVSPTRVHDFLLATHFLCAGIAMFLLLGYASLSFPSALVGGLAWMLNSFALSWQALEHYVAIEMWLPIGVLLADAAVRRRSWTASFALALVLGLLFLGGNVLFVELAACAIFGYAIALAVVDARRNWRALGGTAARLGMAAGLFAGLSAVSALPTLALATASARVSLSYEELGDFALPWDSLLNILRVAPVWAGDPYHVNLFAGTAVGVLALVGLLNRQALARFAVVLGTLTILFMLHTPVTYAVGHLLPGFGNFKPLARAAFLLQFSLAVLAAYGLEALRRRLAARKGIRLTRVQLLAGALAAGVIGGIWIGAGRNQLGASAALVLALASGVAVAFALVPGVVRPDARVDPGSSDSSRLSVPAYIASAAIVVAVAGSIVLQAQRLAPHVMLHQPDDPQYLYPSTPLIRYLERRPEARFLPTGVSFRGSTAMIYPLMSAGGYESLLPSRTQNFWRVVGENLSLKDLEDERLIYAYHPEFELAKLQPRLLARASVAYVVSPPADAVSGRAPDGLKLRYNGRDGRIFSVVGALPGAYLVGGCEDVATPLEALERFVADDFVATGNVVLERPFLREAGLRCVGGSSRRAGTAAVVDRSLNSLEVRVQARRPGWLIVTESWHGGWRATVDRRDADVLPADYAYRAVRVPAGTHTVRFIHQPTSFRVGAVVSAVSLAVTLGGLALTLLLRFTRASATGRRSSTRDGGRVLD